MTQLAIDFESKLAILDYEKSKVSYQYELQTSKDYFIAFPLPGKEIEFAQITQEQASIRKQYIAYLQGILNSSK
jgi:hypothetical protein